MNIGTYETHKKARTRLRKKLRAQGLGERAIALAVDDLRMKQLGRRHDPAGGAKRGAADAEGQRARLEDETYARFALDDRGYKPKPPDKLRSGAGRASGVGAVAVGRSTALTRWQYDQLEAQYDQLEAKA